MPDILDKAKSIKLLVLDVDGVLTDGAIVLDEDGREYKSFNIKDGHGLHMLQAAGLPVAVISGRESPIVARRMAELGITHIHQGHRDKRPVFEALLEEFRLKAEQTAYVGDDVVDLPVMLRAGLAVAVADAHTLVKRHADWVTLSEGGRGAVREVCELIMQAQGSLRGALDRYLL